MTKHIPPDVLARIGAQYIQFVDTFKENHREGTPESYRKHSQASQALVSSYETRHAGCDRPPRYFNVEAGASYTIVAYDPNHAWLLFANEIAMTRMGDEMLDDYEISMTEMLPERVAAAFVHDERDGKPDRYPLSTASVGDVFCSEW